MLHTLNRRNIKIALLILTSAMLIGIGSFVVELWSSNSHWHPTSVAIFQSEVPINPCDVAPKKKRDFSLLPQFSQWKVFTKPEGFSFRYPSSTYIDDSRSYQGDAAFRIDVSVCNQSTCANGPEYAQVRLLTDNRLFCNVTNVANFPGLFLKYPAQLLDYETLEDGTLIESFYFTGHPEFGWIVVTWKTKRVIIEYTATNAGNESFAHSIAQTVQF